MTSRPQEMVTKGLRNFGNYTLLLNTVRLYMRVKSYTFVYEKGFGNLSQE